MRVCNHRFSRRRQTNNGGGDEPAQAVDHADRCVALGARCPWLAIGIQSFVDVHGLARSQEAVFDLLAQIIRQLRQCVIELALGPRLFRREPLALVIPLVIAVEPNAVCAGCL